MLVFDFGSEMYVWSGCRADPQLKRCGTLLAHEMFEDSYNFSEVEHEFSPLGNLVIGDKRPNWCWFKRITHHMEPVLFMEKFFDWPDESGKLIRVKRITESSGKDGGFNFSACDVDKMLEAVKDISDPSLELEGFNVARGSEVHDERVIFFGSYIHHSTMTSCTSVLLYRKIVITQFLHWRYQPGGFRNFRNLP